MSALAVGLSLTVCLVFSELVIRLRGHTPWRYRPEPRRPTTHEADPALGWKNKPGAYLIAPYSSDAETIKMTTLVRRSTSYRRTPQSPAPQVSHRRGIFYSGLGPLRRSNFCLEAPTASTQTLKC